MWIKGVDLPRELVDAHQQGNLAVFVGAGASMAPPSSLPNFESLARDIYTERGVEFPDSQRERLDAALGELMDHHNVPVNERVARKINIPGSRPNGLHTAIATLVLASPTPRLVTTNYDLHLSRALEGAGVEEFHAPALPMGDDFTGLVYLHGSLRQEPRRLVVTDSDFGRAYLGEAWATRFLERMFAEFVVLFVGYSHNDLVMSYLARGLGRSRGRYAITPDPNGRHWRSLGIVPIGYEVVDGSHEAVPEAIQGWADLADMGLTDHQRRIADLASLPLPSQEPEDVSYLEMVLADSERVRFFVEHARGANWLTWAASQSTFESLFDPSAEPIRCTELLAHWSLSSGSYG
jgi:SIR2-like domain